MFYTIAGSLPFRLYINTSFNVNYYIFAYELYSSQETFFLHNQAIFTFYGTGSGKFGKWAAANNGIHHDNRS